MDRRRHEYIYIRARQGVNDTSTATSGITDDAWNVLVAFSTTAGLGSAVASAGDVNGDGYGDLVIGGIPESNTSFTGAVQVSYGGPRGLDTTSGVALSGPGGVYDGGFGASVGAGDFNGDGFGDIVVGAPLYGADGTASEMIVGSVYVYFGGSGGPGNGVKLGPPPALGLFGWTLCANDLNGDGLADLIVGAPAASTVGGGNVYVYSGLSAGLSSTPVATLLGLGSTDSQYAQVVTSPGDIDGDGIADLAVGDKEPFSTFNGQVEVYVGNPSGIPGPGPILAPPLTASDFGTAVGGGDVNGDGFADLVVGAPGANGGQGAAYLFLGPSLGPSLGDAGGGDSGDTSDASGASTQAITLASQPNAEGFGTGAY